MICGNTAIKWLFSSSWKNTFTGYVHLDILHKQHKSRKCEALVNFLEIVAGKVIDDIPLVFFQEIKK